MSGIEVQVLQPSSGAFRCGRDVGVAAVADGGCQTVCDLGRAFGRGDSGPGVAGGSRPAERGGCSTGFRHEEHCAPERGPPYAHSSSPTGVRASPGSASASLWKDDRLRRMCAALGARWRVRPGVWGCHVASGGIARCGVLSHVKGELMSWRRARQAAAQCMAQ